MLVVLFYTNSWGRDTVIGFGLCTINSRTFELYKLLEKIGRTEPEKIQIEIG